MFLLFHACGWAAVIGGATDPTLSMAKNHPQALVRHVIQKELTDTYGTRPPLRYRLRKVTDHTDTTKEIVESKDGGVACLVATGGRPLTTEAQQRERFRLQYLRTHPALQEHRRVREQADSERVKRVIRALPDAFRYTFSGVEPTPNGPAIRLTFVPNPGYRPSAYETRALRGMRGEIWVDQHQQRMVRFEAHQFEDVDFGWGVLGIMDKGGGMLIEQAEVAPPVWALTHLHLVLAGRALLVKPLHYDVEETAMDFQRVANNLPYQQAIDLLLEDNCGMGTALAQAKTRDHQ
ncbi:MAG: hypothetical protein ACP5EP_10915 [Acidobacteriaceae bacterium]